MVHFPLLSCPVRRSPPGGTTGRPRSLVGGFAFFRLTLIRFGKRRTVKLEPLDLGALAQLDDAFRDGVLRQFRLDLLAKLDRKSVV